MGVTHHRSFAALAHKRRGSALGGLLAIAAAIFALGFAAGAAVRPALMPQRAPSIEVAHAAPRDVQLDAAHRAEFAQI